MKTVHQWKTWTLPQTWALSLNVPPGTGARLEVGRPGFQSQLGPQCSATLDGPLFPSGLQSSAGGSEPQVQVLEELENR